MGVGGSIMPLHVMCLVWGNREYAAQQHGAAQSAIFCDGPHM